jgi:hypothetical protein
MASDWTTYRTRFLINARQLDEPLTFVDCIGREHSGQKGDYLVQSSDGSRRIAPREIFEDIYVPVEQPGGCWTDSPARSGTAQTGQRPLTARQLDPTRPLPSVQPTQTPHMQSQRDAHRRASGRIRIE